MANNFQIVISATDRATAAIRRVNQNINRITAPIREVRRATTDLGRELGFGKIASSFGNVTRSARGVADGVRKIIAPMAAVVGVGSIAGVAALATEWGRMSVEIANTSKNLGVATSDLQSLRGAAQMAGVSSESLTGGLLSLGDTLNDAKWGRNQGALALLQRLGVGIHMTADGSIDAVRGLKDMAGAIGRIKSVQTQHLVARQFGIESLLPLLRKGNKAIEEYQRKAAMFGVVRSQDSIDRGEAFGVQLSYLKIAVEGLKASIGDRLVPVLMPLLDKLVNWIVKNRELIATKVAEFVEGFATWLNKVKFDNILAGCTDFIESIGGVVDRLGGWKNVAIGVGTVLTLNVLAPVLSLGLALSRLTLSIIPAAVRALIALCGAQAMGAAAAAAGTAGAGVAASGAAGAVAAGAAGVGAGAATAGGTSVAAAAGIGLAVAAAAAATAYVGYKLGYKGAEYLFGNKNDNVEGATPPAHLRTKADLRAEASRQRVEVGLPPLAPARLMSKSELQKEARQQWIETFGVPRVSRVPLDASKNNPLNLRPGGTQAIYSTMEEGIAAALGNLKGHRYFDGGNNTVAGSAPLGIRTNNPLNLRPGGTQAIYSTMEEGIAAALANLKGKRYLGGGNDTVAGIVNSWSPPNAPGNSPAKNANYIAGVTKEVGSGRLDGNNPQVMAKLLSAMVRMENGAGTYDKEKMDNAISHITLEFKGAPTGTTATARTSMGEEVPVRVATSMPTLVSP